MNFNMLFRMICERVFFSMLCRESLWNNVWKKEQGMIYISKFRRRKMFSSRWEKSRRKSHFLSLQMTKFRSIFLKTGNGFDLVNC